MLVLLVLVVIGFIIWASSSSKSSVTSKKTGQQWSLPQQDQMLQVRQVHQQWIDFIASYSQVAKTKAEKAFLARMLDDIKTQQGGVPSNSSVTVVDGISSSLTSHTMGVAATASVIAETSKSPKPPAVQLDNSSLLLYFGAFLFVASAGLFVGVGSAPGSLKVLTMLLVTVVMYASGMWLCRNRPKLRQAGQAFAGIGVVLAPLVGAALYAYVFNQQHGVLVWLLTSLLCLGLYAHALIVFRTPLMGYILIFTFLSLFESGVGITGLPLYCYGWGLSAAGIILQAVSRWQGWLPELREPSRNGSQLFLPLAVLVSLVNIPQQGVMQLGISLLLAAAFYSLEISRSSGDTQETNAVITQAAVISGFGALAYGYSQSHSLGQHWPVVGVILVALNGVQLLALYLYGAAQGPRRRLWNNYASVLQVASIVSIIVVTNHPGLLVATTIATAVVGTVVWWRQRRPEAYMLASLAWMGLPFIYGQMVLSSITPEMQTFAGLVSLAMLLIVYLAQYQKAHSVSGWVDSAGLSYEVGVISVLFASFFAGPYFCLVVAVALVAMFVLLADADKHTNWSEFAALAILVPLVRSWDNPTAFLVATAVALALLIGLSLRYRREALRWISTFVWLLLPYALGHGGFGAYWPPAAYAWGYVIAMAGLIVSRAIARGRLFLSDKVPLSTMMRSASLSYVYGYTTAAILALGISLTSAQSRLHTSLILAVFGLAVLLLSRVVEKRGDILTLVPFLSQAFLLSVIRPHQSGSMLTGFLLVSTVLAIVTYLIADSVNSATGHRPESRFMVQTALITAFVAPASIIFAHSSWPMSVGLLAAGGLLAHYVRTSSMSQAFRELANGVIALSVMWFLGWAGVHELQAYAYVLVVYFADCAYWRFVRGETKEVDDYLLALLITATVPLALEALNNTDGGPYGWWLLLQQIAIMLLGMSIKRRFVTMWGLYVAVGAVLYQLRGLGYAALAVLALFLIGLAVYRLQKSDKNDSN